MTGLPLGYAQAEVPESVESKLLKADAAWQNSSPGKAIPPYKELVNPLPPTHKPFHSLFIMRLAQAQLAVGNNADSLKTLDLLNTLDYIPEHQALAAKEMRAVIAGEPHPGLQRTAIPAIGPVKASVYVKAGAVGGEGTKSKPVGTLKKAIELARKHRTTAAPGAIEIILSTGTYHVKETVKLTADDAGTNGSPLVIRSENPARPATLTGGTVLKTWKKVAEKEILNRLPASIRGDVLVCNLKDHGIKNMAELVLGGFSSKRAEGIHARFKTFNVPELFYNGEPQTMARWPNDKLIRIAANEVPKKKKDPRSDNWAKEENLWLYGYWGNDWADAYEKVASIESNGKINLVPPVNRYGFNRRIGCVVNALCEIDQPGEWYLDAKRGLIFYLPPNDFDPSKCILSSYNTPITATGCSNLHIRNLKINYVRGDALIIANTSDVFLSGLDIQDCSGMGIQIHGGKRHLVHSCKINSMGRGAIDLLAGDWKKLIPGNSVIENCRISNLSRIDRTYTPAVLLEGMGLKVRYNSFVDIPSSAIRVEACDALIELNYFHRCVYESGDQGAIDMWANPLYRGNIIRWNDFNQIVNNDKHYGAAAVRHDDYISGFMVCENIFRKGSDHGFGAVQFNQGTDNYVEGNIIIDWHKAFTGRSTTGKDWQQCITGHSNSKKMLAETPWESEAWQKKYPMVKDLLNGNDNHNYLVDNLRLGTGVMGNVRHAISFSNRNGDKTFHGKSLEEIKTKLVPWHPIPIERIGPYSATSNPPEGGTANL